MTFTWPWALTLLLLIPLVLGIAWWTRRRRRRSAIRVTSVAAVRVAIPARSRWTRLIPVVLLLLGFATLGVGAARPQASVPVASDSTTIMLALDVSGSMCSTDVSPNRITVAEQAAIAFIEAQKGGPKIGLVTFSGVAGLLVPPTTDTQTLIDAINNLSTSRGTAIGSAILTSVDGIAAINPNVAPTGAAGVVPMAAGQYAPDVIVLLTDGANTQGVEPADAAKVAATRGIRVYTIGFGTTNPTRMSCTGTQAGGFGGGGYGGGFGGSGGGGGGGGSGGGFGGGGGFGPGSDGHNPLVIDEAALQNVASTTGGTYYRAQDADSLTKALADLPNHVTVVHQKIDLAAWFAALGGLLVAVAVGLSLWFNRVRVPKTGGTGTPSRTAPVQA